MRDFTKWLKQNFAWYYYEHDKKTKQYYISIVTRRGNQYSTRMGEHCLKDAESLSRLKTNLIHAKENY